MTNFTKFALTGLVLAFSTTNVYATDICKVSMMGRICYEEVSLEAKKAHIKGDVVAEVSAKRKAKTSESDAKGKKVAGE